MPFAWIGLGPFLAFMSFLFWLALKSSERHPGHAIANRLQAGIVVSPTGIAIVQGELQGQMRWDELRDVRIGGRDGVVGFDAPRAAGKLKLVVDGAVIAVADIYDRPLALIYRVIRQYWRGR